VSTVPAALAALVERLRCSPALAGPTDSDPAVRVEDGPWLDRPSEPDVIVIGWTPDEGQAVELTHTYDMGSGGESYDVVCLASSWSGDTDLAARRARADELVEAVRIELRADQTLGGVVTHAEITSQSWDQYQTSNGCEVPVQFTVHVEASRIP
jgi:hypothetical protein